jgi:peptide/nickel transport system substrate-binding protein
LTFGGTDEQITNNKKREETCMLKGLVAVGLAAGLTIAAANAGMPGGAASAQTPQPKRGGTLNFAVTAEPPNYDCHASQTFALLHPVGPHYSLLLRNAGDKIEGDLAQSWSVSPDGLTYTFKLHETAKFHDGSAVTSADVKATYERIITPPAGVISLRKDRFSDVTAIETPDATTAVFKLKAPNASMAANFAGPFNCIYSAAKLAQNPRYPETEVMGSGAYQFVEHVRGSHWVAKRFDQYFRAGLPYLDGYKGFFVKSSAVVPGLLGGQFDAEFRGQNPSERDQVLDKAKDKFVLNEGPWATVMVVIFNTTKKPFDDPRVRRALSLGIDRWGGSTALSKISIMKHVGGIMRPGSEFGLSEADLATMPGYGRDIEKSREEARQLLKEAGVTDLKFKLHNRNLGEPYSPTGIFLIDQWRRIGVTAEHSQVETKLYFDTIVNGTFEVAAYPQTEPSDDPSALLTMHMTHPGSPMGYARHGDKTIDELFEKQIRSLDPVERRKIVNEVDKRVLTESYIVPIHWWNRIIVHNKRIKGWKMSPSHFQGYHLADVWLDE